MVRSEWQNLNGEWDYAIRSRDESFPAEFDGKILVPFPVESQLSGVARSVTPDQRLWYRRSFEIENLPDGHRWLLHFGAVDWHASVHVNGDLVGEHRGGYDSFSFDITDALRPVGEQQLVVGVWDPTDQGDQPRGKQVLGQ
jgi:beta-galactosidase/beta-glucuronidase